MHLLLSVLTRHRHMKTGLQFHSSLKIDGTGLTLYTLSNTTLFYKYKRFFSMVLLAVCDAKYCFTMFDVGHCGSNNDSGVLLKSKMGKKLAQGSLNIPSGLYTQWMCIESSFLFLLDLTLCQ